MNKLNIRSVARKRKVFRTLAKAEIYHHYENLLNQQFHASHPNQKWVTDITYIATQAVAGPICPPSKICSMDLSSPINLGRENSLLLVLQYSATSQTKGAHSRGIALTQRPWPPIHFAWLCSSSPNTMRLPLPCPDAAIVGIMRLWKISSPISKKKPSANSPLPSFEEAKHIIDDYIHFYNYERIQLKTRQTPYETRCLSA